MHVTGKKSINMKLRDMENAFKYRRIPYPKRSVELIALLAISCTFFLFMHTNKLNSRLREMEIKLQPSEFSALGISGDHHITGNEISKPEDINTLHGTYQYLKSTGQRRGKFGNFQHKHVKQQRRIVDEIYANNDKEEEQEEAEDDDEEIQIGNRHNRQHKMKKPKYQHNEDNYDEYDEYSADSLNNTKNAEIDLIIFNRVPKVGSQALMELMTRLGRINGYIHTRDNLQKHERVLMNSTLQQAIITQILSIPQPLVYTQHVAYMNFTRLKRPKPIYINLVRDPIERIISWHYYIRAKWYYKEMKEKLGDNAPEMPEQQFLDMDLDTCVRENNKFCQFIQNQIANPVGDHRRQTLFFCGQNKKVCMPFNSVAAMQRSKRTVEQDYAVVGTWEDTNITLTVLENYIPKFFKHATVAYYLAEKQITSINKNPTKPAKPISDDTRELLRRNLTREIEFYEFCKQRLYLQYAALNDIKATHSDNDYIILTKDHNKALDAY